jgi:hypothetical protein
MGEYAGGGVPVGNGSQAGSSSVLLPQYNNLQRKLGGNRDSDLDRLWLEMTSGNSRNVGLRPVLVFVTVEKWSWAEHLDELRALGLGWMAA